VLRHDHRIEATVAIAGHVDRHRADIGLRGLRTRALAAVRRQRPLMRFMAQVLGQLYPRAVSRSWPTIPDEASDAGEAEQTGAAKRVREPAGATGCYRRRARRAPLRWPARRAPRSRAAVPVPPPPRSRHQHPEQWSRLSPHTRTLSSLPKPRSSANRRLSRLVARYEPLGSARSRRTGLLQLDSRGAEVMFQILTNERKKHPSPAHQTCHSASGDKSSPTHGSSPPASTA
jgi:hypothetical protein